MARYAKAVCRLCRREGIKLFLKGTRCYTNKCALERRAQVPGQHVQRRVKLSEYGIRLREKQKARRIYGIMERQFEKYFVEASRKKGVTGDMLIQLLEKRLDNVVFRLGFANSRAQARQLVRHGHFLVNQRRVNIPSLQVKLGDEIILKETSRGISIIKESLEASSSQGVPEWLELNAENFVGRVKRLPKREEIAVPVQERMIVEFYSR